MEETQRSFWRALAGCRTERPEDKRNSWIATGLLFVWAVAYVAVSFLIKKGHVEIGTSAHLLALLPVAVSVVAVLAYMRFILRADELLRKIQLEALAFGFGGGFIATFALDLAEKLGYGPYDIATPLLYMIGFWFVGFLTALWRYA